jgi:hypothetical protein
MRKETGITRNVSVTNEQAGVMLIATSFIHCCQRSLSHLSLRSGAVHLNVGKDLQIFPSGGTPPVDRLNVGQSRPHFLLYSIYVT